MPEHLTMTIRPISENDLKNICRLQAKAYAPLFCEKEEVFKEKLSFFPEGCWLALSNENLAAESCAGYIFSHPWNSDSPASLNSAFENIPEKFDCFYIHDMAVSPEHQGKGVGNILFSKIKQIAKDSGYKRIMAVSVQNSTHFWTKMGFAPVENLNDSIRNKLQSYGDSCSYMISKLKGV